MDFQLTVEQRDIQTAAREFALGEFDPDAAMEYDAKQEFPMSIWKKACELGFLGVRFPEEAGRQGCGLVEHTLIIESFCRQDSGMGTALALAGLGSEIILRHGREEQKSVILPLAAQGQGIVTAAILEEAPDFSSIKTEARAIGNGFVINGAKSFVTLGVMASYMIVSCRSGDNPSTRVNFLLEPSLEGISVSDMGNKLGLRMIPVNRVRFTDVKVSEESMIGRNQNGDEQLRDFFLEVRIETGAMGIGIAQGSWDRALAYGKKREQFGKAVVSFGAIRNKLADTCLDIEMARLVTYKAAWSFDRGRPDNRETLIARMAATRAAYRAAYEAVQIFGGYGYMTEAHIERFYRDAKALELLLEQTPIQRSLLADELVGKGQ
ncbi:MAG: acyl-CoA dehydrogenase family protein [Thermodesulfobacteriota bacterium]